MATEDKKGENVLGDTAEVTFVSLRGHTLKGKVDTGADVCSLHADHITVDSGRKVVHFSSKLLTGNTNVITLPLHDQQAVKSANAGVKYRPIVSLTVKINGKLLESVLFNLSDRSGLAYPVLIGQNALELGKFIINPTLETEVVSMDSPDMNTNTNVDPKEKIIEAMTTLLTSNISLQQALAWYEESKTK